MSYRTCFLCRYWDERSERCSVHGTYKSSTDYCSSIELIPCCASCKHWDKNSDYTDMGNCRIFGNRLSSASSICRDDYYTKR